MKKELLYSFRKKNGMMLFVAFMLLFASCVDGYKDEVTWTSSVRDTNLESPAVDDITIRFNAGEETQTIGWPLVPGAGGYQVSVYNIDNPDQPIPIGVENQIVDKPSIELPATEDTRYKVLIKTMGNPTNNNKEAASATEKLYDNMLAVTAIIPSGTNLTDYFTTNPIPASPIELCYELEAGGEYTMNGNVSIGQTSVTIRGNKVNRPKLTVTEGSFVNGGGGFKLRFMEIDYNNFAGGTSSAVILMDSNFPETGLTGSGYAVTPLPVAIESCKITGLKYYLFYDNGQKYAMGTFLIKDCVIGRSANQNAAEIRFAAGMAKDMTFINSTFYSEAVGGDNRLIQISSGNATSVQPIGETWVNGGLTVTNCTFYQVAKGSHSFNANGAFRLAGDNIIIMNTLFVDSFNKEAIRRFRSSNAIPTFTGNYNSYWFDGEFPTNEVEHNQGDKSGTHIETNPELTYLGNGEFRMEGAAQIARRVGDPRWLPAQ